jgi:hypothetical protein
MWMDVGVGSKDSSVVHDVDDDDDDDDDDSDDSDDNGGDNGHRFSLHCWRQRVVLVKISDLWCACVCVSE